MLTIPTAWALARDWFGDKLHPQWRRHTLDETRQLFQTLGLEGDFWQL